jgi:hypothetical protein
MGIPLVLNFIAFSYFRVTQEALLFKKEKELPSDYF